MKARLYWDDGRIEDVRGLGDDVQVIVRQGAAGLRRFVRADDLDPEGFEVFIEDDEDDDEQHT
jgi:hypothetical protein